MKYAIAILLSTVLWIGCSQGQPENSEKFIKSVDATKFKKLLDSGQGIVLDVRTPEEVAAGQIQNSSTINFYDEDFITKINLIPKDKEIYVYCAAGGRSSSAADILQENGFNKVYNLEGGIRAWQANNYPIVKANIVADNKIKEFGIKELDEILATDKPVLIDFHTLWCVPCRKLAPVIDSLESQYQNKAMVLRIDVDKSVEISEKYKIQGVPVLMIFKNNEIKWQHKGIISKKELENELAEFL